MFVQQKQILDPRSIDWISFLIGLGRLVLKGQCSNFYTSKSENRIQGNVSENVRVQEKLYQRPLWVQLEPCEI